MKNCKRIILGVITSGLILMMLSGCRAGNGERLDPNNPVTINVWNHFTGAVLNAFDASIREFNETVGTERGIIVQGRSLGNVSDLARAVRAAVYEEIGSEPLPHIFTSFADTAYIAKQNERLVNLDNYFSVAELQEFYTPFLDGGRIGLNGELYMLPVAVATEIMMVNHTDWVVFAAESGVTYDDLATMEGVVRVAQTYYNWSGGKSFFGRDQFANLFTMGSKQFGVEIFELDSAGRVTVNVDEQVMRLIWDNYYVPHISGYFAAHGRFRSDDLRVGDILAYSGSTVSAAFFPTEVRVDGESRPIDAMVLPMPVFEGGERVLVRQGANMVVTKTTDDEQYASKIFLQWFTDPQQNVAFSALSGHMPVRYAAMDYGLIRAVAEEQELELTIVTDYALRVALDDVRVSRMYSTPAFDGGTNARNVLYNHLRDKAIADRAAVLEMTAEGMLREDAIATFAAAENFYNWLADFEAQLLEAVGQ